MVILGLLLIILGAIAILSAIFVSEGSGELLGIDMSSLEIFLVGVAAGAAVLWGYTILKWGTKRGLAHRRGAQGAHQAEREARPRRGREARGQPDHPRRARLTLVPDRRCPAPAATSALPGRHITPCGHSASRSGPRRHLAVRRRAGWRRTTGWHADWRPTTSRSAPGLSAPASVLRARSAAVGARQLPLEKGVAEDVVRRSHRAQARGSASERAQAQGPPGAGATGGVRRGSPGLAAYDKSISAAIVGARQCAEAPPSHMSALGWPPAEEAPA